MSVKINTVFKKVYFLTFDLADHKNRQTFFASFGVKTLRLNTNFKMISVVNEYE